MGSRKMNITQIDYYKNCGFSLIQGKKKNSRGQPVEPRAVAQAPALSCIERRARVNAGDRPTADSDAVGA